MNDAHTVLVTTMALIQDEKNWCKLAAARDRSGNLVQPHHKDAFAFCLLAAIAKAAEELKLESARARQFVVEAIMEILVLEEMRVSILGFNDTTDHATVLRALTRATELAAAAEAA